LVERIKSQSSDELKDALDALNVPRKFLVVDDTPSNSKMLSMVLKSRNIECDIAVNGQEAVDLMAAQGDQYDFIFMDFTMPIMNGADASSAIRKNGHNRLIFGLTGNALDDDKCTFLEAGADCVITKPLRAHQLDAILAHTSVHGFQSSTKAKLSMEIDASNKAGLSFV
jgi:CheY-like chemotaxis protein